MTRFAVLGMEDLDAPARALAERVMTRSSNGIGGPFNMLLRSPELGQRMVDLLDYFNEGVTPLPAPCRRLAVLMLARRAGARYAWWSHRRAALCNGEFTELQLDALNRMQSPQGLNPQQSATYDFVEALKQGTPTPQSVLAELKAVFSEAQIVDLIVLCGTYATVAMLLNEAEVGLPEGEADTLLPDRG